jgi:hypothetical protein
VPPSDSARFREGTLPAGAFDVLDELGDELVAEVRPEVPRVQLHVPLQHDVEEHLASLALLRGGRRRAESCCPSRDWQVLSQYRFSPRDTSNKPIMCCLSRQIHVIVNPYRSN